MSDLHHGFCANNKHIPFVTDTQSLHIFPLLPFSRQTRKLRGGHREGLAAQWLNHLCAICQRLVVTHSNTGPSAALPRQSHTATPGLLLLYPASHTQQHRVFCCLTPPVTHSNTGSFDLPRQSQAGVVLLLAACVSATAFYRPKEVGPKSPKHCVRDHVNVCTQKIG